MGFKQHISRTWQMIEQQVNDVPFRPDNEVLTERQIRKTQWLCGFRELQCLGFTPFTPNLRQTVQEFVQSKINRIFLRPMTLMD